jgi:hypothetical protein
LRRHLGAVEPDDQKLADTVSRSRLSHEGEGLFYLRRQPEKTPRIARISRSKPFTAESAEERNLFATDTDSHGFENL